MRHSNFHHVPKSSMAFAVDLNTLHIRFKSIKGTAHTVSIIHGDPFDWGKNADGKFWRGAQAKPTPMTLEASTKSHDYWFATIHVPTKRIKYAFLIDEQVIFTDKYLVDIHAYPSFKNNLNAFYNFPYILKADLYQAPAWVKDTVWYSIFPDRFHNLDNASEGLSAWESNTAYRNDQFYGGNLQGITEKLPYLKTLGFTGIYLTPLFKSPSAHKYDTIDFFELDPQFGTKEDLRTMVDTAHALGIKVMLDAVFNHVSLHHPFFQDVLKHGSKSPYYDYFFIHEWPIDAGKLDKRPAEGGYETPPYETFAFTTQMPKLNADHPDLKHYLQSVATYWIEHFDIDGWRLDVSNEISHDFWRDFRKTVKSLKKDVFILAENWDQSNPWLMGDQHDAVMNYEFLYPMWAFFGVDEPFEMDASQFSDAINHTLFNYPRPVILNMFNIMDSHDTKRIARVVGEDRETLKQVYLMQYLLPGTPSVFYGGEIGLTGDHDPDNRRCMIWDGNRQDKTLQTYIRTLNGLYHTYEAFKSPGFKVLYAHNDTIIIEKAGLIALFNRANTMQKVSGLSLEGTYSDLFNEQPVTLGKSIELPPQSGTLLMKARA